jgi:hypothetical protein
VHGLQLGVVPIEPLQRPDSQERAVSAEAKEHNRWIQESVYVKGMTVLGWAVRIRERKVALQQFAHVLTSRIIEGDLALSHGMT